MESENKTTIIVDAIINAPIEVVWELWTTPDHIINWNYASDNWHTPFAETTSVKEENSFFAWKQKMAVSDLILRVNTIGC